MNDMHHIHQYIRENEIFKLKWTLSISESKWEDPFLVVSMLKTAQRQECRKVNEGINKIIHDTYQK